MKTLLSALAAFLFIMFLGMYIMGGYDHQTVYSKLASSVIGICFAGFVVIGIKSEELL